MGVPACAGHELTGLYGLEMRTVTAALNASILPTALAIARLVEEAVRRDLPDVSLLVMRGDGGAVSLDIMKRQPLLTTSVDLPHRWPEPYVTLPCGTRSSLRLAEPRPM